ncbi:energy-coupling factor ABC transporter permease [Oceanobacter mangrovi]|uniref:energy-coupling factor ABC transporter permease n=1 Tax=Oceanobacter mangrovi TaxID=2862510 RepID=UPI001C8E81DD|nr:energy-coupling factor ABC transporter permease [Oceanobacter mangrovi]
MHIEPGMVVGAKAILGSITAAGSLAVVGHLAVSSIKSPSTLLAFGIRSVIATLAVLFMFQVLPHPPIGVSEVHLILGSTLFLLFGAGPAAAGLAGGLLLQGLLFAPFDLPQYSMNVTTLIAPLLAIHMLAKRLIASDTAYKDISYKQALALSTTYQAGIVSWVAFWSFYGMGFTAESVMAVASFAAAYMSVILLEPLIDLAALGCAKTLARHDRAGVIQQRVFSAAN